MSMTTGYQSATLTIRPIETHAHTETPDGAWHVFLSSTIKDLEDYRREVQDVLLKRAQVACFLSEDWINSYAPTSKKCQDEIKKAAGYIGIFAYCYGSIPEDSEKSITHLEFSWALDKWKENSCPPIAILMPKSPSPAEIELKERAAALIPANEDEQKKHHERLINFHKEVTQTWRMVNWFRDQQELREHVLVICMQWRIGRPIDAATGAVEVIEQNTSRKVTDEEWGLLGRERQRDAFKKVFSRVASHRDVPALAILIHGPEDAGQRFFVKQLLTEKQLNSGRPASSAYNKLSSEQYDVRLLTQLVGKSLGVLSAGKEVGSPEELADLIFEELKSQQICFVLDRIHWLSGRVTAFYESFWRPLYTRLAELRRQLIEHAELHKQKPTLHRLVAVLVDYQDQSGLPDTVAREFVPTASAEDYSRLLMLPVLNDISDDDLRDWFEELEIPDSADGRREKLVDIALMNASGGIDGTPFLVFDRLSNETLWPEGEES